MKTKIDVSQVPFSMRGSYMAICLCQSQIWNSDSSGLYLRNIHGDGEPNRQVCRFIPTWEGQDVPFSTEARPALLQLITSYGVIEICFANPETILVRGSSGMGLRLDQIHDGLTHNYIHPVGNTYILNVLKNYCRYSITCNRGECSIRQDTFPQPNGMFAGPCEMMFAGSDGFEFSLREISQEHGEEISPFDFDCCVEQNDSAFSSFYKTMPSVPDEYTETAQLASYVNWASLVRPCGLFKREAMLMSKNWMTNVWTWDPCFNAIALAYGNPSAAWDQFMIMFDQQDSSGRLPDCINDMRVQYNFCKPPIHGWALGKLMEIMPLTHIQMEDAYTKLAALTEFWLNYRDSDNDGICEYYHGNDSGWDNSTAFKELPPVELPDLNAFLIVQMDVLSNLAKKLGRYNASSMWATRADCMMNAFLTHCFDEDGVPIAVKSGSHLRVENDSLILYMPVILGKRLPKKNRNKLIQILSSERFLTPYGLATESPHSPEYRADGYWRGPIWAPSTMLLVDGLHRCGATELACEIAKRFGKLAQKSGFAENYDALTGEGLRDRAYTWTSSAFLIMMHEYGAPLD